MTVEQTDILGDERIAEIQRRVISQHGPSDVVALLRHAAALQAQLDAATKECGDLRERCDVYAGVLADKWEPDTRATAAAPSLDARIDALRLAGILTRAEAEELKERAATTPTQPEPDSLSVAGSRFMASVRAVRESANAPEPPDPAAESVAKGIVEAHCTSLMGTNAVVVDDPARLFRDITAALQARDAQVIADRDELSATIEACHKMLDQLDDDYEEGTTTMTPLDTRLREFLWPEGRITDDMVNGDD